MIKSPVFIHLSFTVVGAMMVGYIGHGIVGIPLGAVVGVLFWLMAVITVGSVLFVVGPLLDRVRGVR
jgi:hypothetical protein